MYVSNILLKKAHDGSWFVSTLFTSEGSFDLGQEISKSINQKILGTTVDEIKQKVIPQVENFIKDEVEQAQKVRKEK